MTSYILGNHTRATHVDRMYKVGAHMCCGHKYGNHIYIYTCVCVYAKDRQGGSAIATGIQGPLALTTSHERTMGKGFRNMTK